MCLRLLAVRFCGVWAFGLWAFAVWTGFRSVGFLTIEDEKEKRGRRMLRGSGRVFGSGPVHGIDFDGHVFGMEVQALLALTGLGLLVF